MQEDWKPKEGMVFDSIDDAWKFYIDYGARVGFGVRKQYTHKKKDGSATSCRFVCCKEGFQKPDKRDYKTVNPRPETRTNCDARLGLKNMGGRFVVHDFVEEHNHILNVEETTPMLSSLRQVLGTQGHQIVLVDDDGLEEKNSFDLMSKEVDGGTNLEYTRLDKMSCILKKRQRSLVREEVGHLLQYFQRMLVENPTFYHAYQIDAQDQITNVFWADARMLIDYGYFGDVLCLDSTYCTNSSHRPLAVFSGFNHHRKAVIFGAALLYDTTVESYKWLFETFLEAHRQKMPQTVFTDLDQTLEKALAEVMTGTYHCICAWLLIQHGIKHLGNLMKGESHFLSDFKKCMYDCEDEEQFEELWRTLLVKYGVKENTWLQRVYTMKEKWASCYTKKGFTLGMQSTLLSESVNAYIGSFVNMDMDIIKFFKRFEDVVEENRYNEFKCEHEARQKIPSIMNPYSNILQQVSEVYTLTIFDLFQQEYELFEACSVKGMNMNTQTSSVDYVIVMVMNSGEWQVSIDLDKKSIRCSCRKFESFGILCCHCLKVFIHMDVKSMPEHYILKRWTKLARTGALPIGVSRVVEDVNLTPMQRYKEICPRLIRIATEACRSQEAFMFLCKVTDELDRQILEFQKNQASNSQVKEFLGKVEEIARSNGDQPSQKEKNGDSSDSERQMQYMAQ